MLRFFSIAFRLIALTILSLSGDVQASMSRGLTFYKTVGSRCLTSMYNARYQVKSQSDCLVLCYQATWCAVAQHFSTNGTCTLYTQITTEAYYDNSVIGSCALYNMKCGSAALTMGYYYNYTAVYSLNIQYNYSNAVQGCQNYRLQVAKVTSQAMYNYLVSTISMSAPWMFWTTGYRASNSSAGFWGDGRPIDVVTSNAAPSQAYCKPGGLCLTLYLPVSAAAGLYWVECNACAQWPFCMCFEWGLV